MYIGSTGVSVTLREANRMSVLRKLERGQEAQSELAIRYWHQNSCFQQFTLIKIASCQSYRAAWTLEHLLISQWQPELNYPYAQVFLKRTALGFRPARQQRFASFSRFGIRLWRKLRKRLFHSVQPFECTVQRRQAWEILYDLSSFTRASFDALKLLRSQRLVDDEVYSIVRLSLCLEEPLKTRVRNSFKKVVKFRKMTWPAHQACLSIPFMSHASFSASVDRWLKTLVLHFRPLLGPLDLPSARVREAALQSCKGLLHNVPIWDRFLLEMVRRSFRASVLVFNFLMSTSQLELSNWETCTLICGILDKAVLTPLSFLPKPRSSQMRLSALTNGDGFMGSLHQSCCLSTSFCKSIGACVSSV